MQSNNNSQRLSLLFYISRFIAHYGMMELKMSTFDPQIGENCFFAPLILRGHIWTPQ